MVGVKGVGGWGQGVVDEGVVESRGGGWCGQGWWSVRIKG